MKYSNNVSISFFVCPCMLHCDDDDDEGNVCSSEYVLFSHFSTK